MASVGRLRRWVPVVLGVFLAFAGGCQKEKPVQPAATSEARISVLQVDKTVLAPGDSVSIGACVVEGADPGTPVQGLQVTFGRMLEQTGGTFSKAECLTDVEGWARTVFRASDSDTGQVTLKVTASSSIKYAVLHVTNGSGGSSSGSGISLICSTADSVTSIPADGLTQLVVTVRAVRGTSRTPVAALKLVLAAGDRFIDVNGDGRFDGSDQVDPTGDRNGDGLWESEGSAPDSVITDGQGVATFVYRAGTTVGPVYLRITGGGGSKEVILQQHTLQLQVTLTPQFHEILADGVSQGPVTVKIKDWSGAPVGGVLVKFVAGEPFTDVNGDGYYTPGVDTFQDDNHNGKWDAIGTISSVATTSSDGTATVAYQAGLTAGPATIRATATGGSAQAPILLVTTPPASSLAVSLAAGSLPADGATSTAGTVTVTDVNGNPRAGKRVRLCAGERFDDRDGDGRFTPGVDVLLDDANGDGLWTAEGTIDSVSVTGADGRAAFTYVAGRTTGAFWVHAAVDGVTTDAPVALTPQVTVSTQTNQLLADGTSETNVAVRIVDGSGASVQGILVRFAAGEPFTDLDGNGYFTPGVDTFQDLNRNGIWDAIGAIASTAVTGPDGVATVAYRAGLTPGPVTIHVTTPAGATNAVVTLLALPPAGNLTLSLGAASLPADGVSATTGIVGVTDPGGNPLAGKIVTLTVDAGTIDPSVVTGADGHGSFTYKAGLAAGTTWIHAQIDGLSQQASIVLTTPSSQQLCRLTLRTADPEIAVAGTGGHEQTAVQVQGFDCSQNAVGAGLPIVFRIDSGPGGGEHFTSCQCDTVTAYTDAMGGAQVYLMSGTKAGTVLIEAQAGGTTPVTSSARVGIAAGPPASLAVGVDSCNVTACNIVGVKNGVAILAWDVYHNPVRDSTAVHVSCSPTGMVVGEDGQGTSLFRKGVATATWLSTGPCGIVTILAETNGGALVAQSSFIASGLSASAQFVVPVGLVSMPADGKSTMPLEVSVLDGNGLFMHKGTEVDYAALYGQVSGQTTTVDGCNASISKATYTAMPLTQDYSYTIPDDGIGGTDIITATAGLGGATATVHVRLLTGAASGTNSSFDLGNVPPSSLTFFMVLVEDAFGNRLGGHRLSISATGGTVDTTGVTDGYGIAGGLKYVAPAADGQVIVQVRDRDPGYGGDMILRKTITIGN